MLAPRQRQPPPYARKQILHRTPPFLLPVVLVPPRYMWLRPCLQSGFLCKGTGASIEALRCVFDLLGPQIMRHLLTSCVGKVVMPCAYMCISIYLSIYLSIIL